MRRFLILVLACLFGMAGSLYAQVPQQISAPGKFKPNPPSSGHPEMPCNSAGSFTLGPFMAQSNDTTLPVIFLCGGDMMFIKHLKDSDLSGDPIPATPAGIAWAAYTCPPTVDGPTLQDIAPDPCILVSPANSLPLISFGDISGDIKFNNTGFLQNTFNSGQPAAYYFAPITIDDFDGKAYESAQVGFPPGPCVNANIGSAFEVVYLNPIVADGLTANAGNDCVGRFVPKGGYPQFDKDGQYDIDIFLTSDPTVKALIYTSKPQYKSGTPILFSVTVPGQYTIVIEDGKSCGFTGTVDMTPCNPADNLKIVFPDTIAPPGTQICVPIKVENFNNLLTTNFTLQWDNKVLQYVGIQKAHPATSFNALNNLNEQFTADGKLGFIFFKNSGGVITIPNDGTLIEVCFDVIGPLGSCTGLTVTNDPSQIGAENINSFVGMTIDTGSVCVKYFPLILLDSIINPTCNGTATLKVIGKGGQAPYDVSWAPLPSGTPVTTAIIAADGGIYTSPVGALMNGKYSVCIQDGGSFGKTICDTITVDIQILTTNLDFGLPKCFGDSTGTVTANVLLGSLPAPDPSAFTYDWTGIGPLKQNQPVQTNVAAGQYSVTVTDKATQCFFVAAGGLGQPFPIGSQSVTTTPATCSGVDDGTITYIAKGGTAFTGSTYDFTWTYSPTGAPGTFQPVNGTINENPSLLSGRPAGTYQVTIEDANGCTFSDKVVITNQRTVSIDLASLKGTNCADGSDGSISITMSSTPPVANPNYTFIWVGGGPSSMETSTPTTSILSKLSAGAYGLTALDAAGCSDTSTFVVTSPTKVVLDTVELKNPTCTGITDGKITVKAMGGTTSIPGQYAIFWTAPLPPGTTQTGLGEGTYKVVAQDDKKCGDSLSFTLKLPTPPTITNVGITAVKCGADGCLGPVTTALPATSFVWQTLTGTNVGNTSQVCKLDGGTYVVTVKDANNCTTKDTFTLAPVVPLSIDSATLNKPKCFGDSNGSIIPSISGGKPAYKYLWAPGNSTLPALNGVKAGVYNLTVTDQNNCTSTETFDLQNPPSINAQYINAVQTTCSDKCNGAAEIDVKYSDGTTGVFTYKWSDPNGGANPLRTDLCKGTYTVTVSDGNNCFSVVNVIVGGPAPLDTTSMIADDATCNGGSDGSVQVTPKGGTSPYTFKWSAPNGPVTPVVGNLKAAAYTVTVTDSKGCTKEFSKIVGEPLPIVVQPDLLLTEVPRCFGNEDGSVAVIASGGNPGGWTYKWEDSNGNAVGTENPIKQKLGAGYYSVTVTDPLGCTGQLDSFLLSDPPPVLGSYKPYEALSCYGDETILAIDTITGGAGAPYQFSIDNGAALPITVPITVGGGEHIVTYLDRIGCEFTETITIPEPAPIVVTFDPAKIEIELGESVKLLPIITGPAVDSFVWMPAQSLLGADSLLNPFTNTFKSEVFKLTVFDANGCSGTGSVTVLVDPNRNVYIPNAFAPGNTDGRNFTFSPIGGNGVKDVNYFQVYDRWGELMYERTKFEMPIDEFGDGWDGRFKGSYVQPGVYIYVVEVNFLDGRTLLYRGDVTVLR